MLPHCSPRSRSAAMILLAGAGSLSLASGATLGADSGLLTIDVSPNVVTGGHAATVHGTGKVSMNDYSFGLSKFHVLATYPGWLTHSGGVVMGDDVVSIVARQAHDPLNGAPAPTGIVTMFRGNYAPQTTAPALIEFKAVPESFTVYPDRLTPWSAERPVETISDYLFVNPLRVGRWLTAPGPGTEARVSDDVWVDGRIITGQNDASASAPIVLGLLVPAVQVVRESAARVEMIGDPVTFTATVQTVLEGRPTESMSINFTKISYSYQQYDDEHRVHTSLPGGWGSSFGGFLGGVRVASGDLNGDGPGPNGGAPALAVSALPQRIITKVGTGTLTLAGTNTYSGTTQVQQGLTHVLMFDTPTPVIVRGAEGQLRTLVVDTIEVQSKVREAAQFASGNNLRQIGLGAHTFEAVGVERLRVTPEQPR